MSELQQLRTLKPCNRTSVIRQSKIGRGQRDEF
jgi:hypothetical protein